MAKKQSSTRVFKKASQNGKITVYLGRRDFVDHITHVDPIDGVVLVDPEYLDGRKVYGHVQAAFRYGREDLDVLGLAGLTFQKDLYLASSQIYPPDEKSKDLPKTWLQTRLMKKLGEHAHPFYFELPPHCPASVTLQPAPGDTGKPCGIDYEMKAFVGHNPDDKPSKRSSVRLAIRKVMYAPSKPGEQPSVEVSKEFMMSPSKLHMEVSLDKELYYHGESISVNVHIQNNSNKPVKRIKVAVRQFSDICLFSKAQYKSNVAEVESDEGFPIGSGSTLNKVYSLTPLLANNKDKWGLALDGQLKHEDTNLASSTLVTDNNHKENLGILVQYRVKVKLLLGTLLGELVAELPFTLMHPKPDDEQRPSSSSGSHKSDSSLVRENGKARQPDPATPPPTPAGAKCAASSIEEASLVDTNLIQLDTDASECYAEQDDDIIFEDFARLRLKGEAEAE